MHGATDLSLGPVDFKLYFTLVMVVVVTLVMVVALQE